MNRTKELARGNLASTVMAAVKLYEELAIFTHYGEENFKNSRFKLKNYTEWFPQPSFFKISDILSK
jgi:hypothetical protein